VPGGLRNVHDTYVDSRLPSERDSGLACRVLVCSVCHSKLLPTIGLGTCWAARRV